VWKELSGTVETSTCRGLTRRVIDGIRLFAEIQRNAG
jgi:hypothetical protein